MWPIPVFSEELGQILDETAGITHDEVVEFMFEQADADKTGRISFAQFLQLMQS